MKHVILSMVGMLIIFYTITIGFSVLSTQTRKNELENNLARIVEVTLENYYLNGYGEAELSELQQNLINEIEESLGEDADVLVQIQAFDMQKGIISVRVEESYQQFNGKTKILSCEKTAIVEKRNPEKQMVTVQFLVEGEVYKEYQLLQGEVCPMPKLPESGYIGWQAEGVAADVPLEEIGTVWEDTVYVAISE